VQTARYAFLCEGEVELDLSVHVDDVDSLSEETTYWPNCSIAVHTCHRAISEALISSVVSTSVLGCARSLRDSATGMMCCLRAGHNHISVQGTLAAPVVEHCTMSAEALVENEGVGDCCNNDESDLTMFPSRWALPKRTGIDKLSADSPASSAASVGAKVVTGNASSCTFAACVMHFWGISGPDVEVWCAVCQVCGNALICSLTTSSTRSALPAPEALHP
jgi:hypothetical protein